MKLAASTLAPAAILAAAILAVAIPARAATIISIGPNTGSSFRVGGPNTQVEEIGWTQTTGFSGMTVAALVGSEAGGTTVGAYLTHGTGAAAGVPVASATVAIGSFATDAAITLQTLFSGLTLAAGTYDLTLFNADASGTTNIRWARGTAVTFGAGVTGDGERFANVTNGTPNTANPPASVFVLSTLYDQGLSVTGTPIAATVPAPAMPLVLAAMAAIAALRPTRRGA